MRFVLKPIAATVAVVLALSGAVTAAADPFRPSVRDQIKLGQDAAAQIRKQERVLPASDPRVKELRRLGEALTAMIPEDERRRRPFQYTFDVIDSKEVNAFALPGGPIFFYTGLLDRMKTEDELAGILGHEIVHIRNQHWASAYADNLKRRLGLLILLSSVGANENILNAADMLDSVLVGLPYSRRHETEADRVGYDMMVAAGFNPQGLVDVFSMLDEASRGSRPPEFLSTHPDTGRRVKVLRERIGKDNRKFPAMRPRKSTAARSTLTWIDGWPQLGLGRQTHHFTGHQSDLGPILAQRVSCCPHH